MGLPENFVRALRDEDDWSFVIKCHALLETLIAQILLERVSHPALNPILSKKSIRDKCQMLEALDPAYLNRDEQKALTALGELRNGVVHNISRTQLDLERELREAPGGTRLLEIFAKVAFDGPLPEAGTPLGSLTAKQIVWSAVVLVAAILHTDLTGLKRSRESYQTLRWSLGTLGEMAQGPDAPYLRDDVDRQERR